MGIGLRDRNLIFLISQPRAGSTLLQRMLGSHPDVHTVSEPWLMLHPLYALRAKGHQAEYNAYVARSALRGFLQQLPGREDDYIEGVRRMYTYLYEQALAGSAKRYFLDKTPRYYFIIPELYRTFPQAQYIVLLRNPLAVLCSVLNTWVREDWFRLHTYGHDLVRAPRLLAEGLSALGEQGVAVHYEQLVRDPGNETRRVCDRLGIKFAPEMVEYGGSDLPRWRFGDREEVYERRRPAAEKADKWVDSLADAQIWRLANDYLQLLGRETLEDMGYPYEELRQLLGAHQPRWIRARFTFPLVWLLEEPKEQRRSWLRGIGRLSRSVRHRGIRGTVVTAVRKVAYTLSDTD